MAISQTRSKHRAAHQRQILRRRRDVITGRTISGLAKRGVPMFYVKSGQTLAVGGAEAGEAAYQEYNTDHYHAASDEYSEDWDWAGVMQDLNLYFQLARALGDNGEWPNWNEGDEFRAVRDASCASDDEGC